MAEGVKPGGDLKTVVRAALRTEIQAIEDQQKQLAGDASDPEKPSFAAIQTSGCEAGYRLSALEALVEDLRTRVAALEEKASG